jgi:hypothetical protein
MRIRLIQEEGQFYFNKNPAWVEPVKP